MANPHEKATWPDLAEGLYSFLTGRGATIEYSFDDMEIQVPRDSADDAPPRALESERNLAYPHHRAERQKLGAAGLWHVANRLRG